MTRILSFKFARWIIALPLWCAGVFKGTSSVVCGTSVSTGSAPRNILPAPEEVTPAAIAMRIDGAQETSTGYDVQLQLEQPLPPAHLTFTSDGRLILNAIQNETDLIGSRNNIGSTHEEDSNTMGIENPHVGPKTFSRTQSGNEMSWTPWARLTTTRDKSTRDLPPEFLAFPVYWSNEVRTARKVFGRSHAIESPLVLQNVTTQPTPLEGRSVPLEMPIAPVTKTSPACGEEGSSHSKCSASEQHRGGVDVWGQQERITPKLSAQQPEDYKDGDTSPTEGLKHNEEGSRGIRRFSAYPNESAKRRENEDYQSNSDRQDSAVVQKHQQAREALQQIVNHHLEEAAGRLATRKNSTEELSRVDSLRTAEAGEVRQDFPKKPSPGAPTPDLYVGETLAQSRTPGFVGSKRSTGSDSPNASQGSSGLVTRAWRVYGSRHSGFKNSEPKKHDEQNEHNRSRSRDKQIQHAKLNESIFSENKMAPNETLSRRSVDAGFIKSSLLPRTVSAPGRLVFRNSEEVASERYSRDNLALAEFHSRASAAKRLTTSPAASDQGAVKAIKPTIPSRGMYVRMYKMLPIL